MSAAAAVLAIVVAAGETQSPLTAGLRATASEALGPGISIRVLEVRDPTDADTLRIEKELGAGAVVTLLWKEPAHLHASMRLHVARTDRWTTRTIAFLPADTPSERGRTLGLAVGSMWPEILAETPPRPRAEAEPGSAPLITKQPAKEAPREPAREPPNEALKEAPTGSARAPTPEPERAREAVRGPAREPAIPVVSIAGAPISGSTLSRRVGIGVAAVGALGIPREAPGLGASVDGVFSVQEHVSVRVGVGLRHRSLLHLPGTDWAGSIAAGVEWWPIWPLPSQGWGLGVRGDLLALGHVVRSNPGIDGKSETRSRVLPGVDLFAQSRFRLGSRLDLLLGLGCELAMNGTNINKGVAMTVDQIPSTQMVGQAAVRAEF